MDYLAIPDTDAPEPCLLCGGHVRVPGADVDCLTCQVSGPWSAADGSVVYVAPVARHDHEGTRNLCSEQLKAWDQEPGEDELAAMVTRELPAAEVGA